MAVGRRPCWKAIRRSPSTRLRITLPSYSTRTSTRWTTRSATRRGCGPFCAPMRATYPPRRARRPSQRIWREATFGEHGRRLPSTRSGAPTLPRTCRRGIRRCVQDRRAHQPDAALLRSEDNGAALLGASPRKLLLDFSTFGLFFESLCVRDLRVYAAKLRGTVYHYRDKTGLKQTPSSSWTMVAGGPSR